MRVSVAVLRRPSVISDSRARTVLSISTSARMDFEDGVREQFVAL